MTYIPIRKPPQCSPRGVVTNYGAAPAPVPTTSTTTTTTTTPAKTQSPAVAVVRLFFAKLGRNDFSGAAAVVLASERSCFLGDYTTFPVHITLTSVQIGSVSQKGTSATVAVKLKGHATTPFGSPAFPSGLMRMAAVGGHWYVDYEHSFIFKPPCLHG